jgi:hypothetical protein
VFFEVLGGGAEAWVGHATVLELAVIWTLVTTAFFDCLEKRVEVCTLAAYTSSNLHPMLLVVTESGIYSSIIYALLGIALAIFATKVIDWITPGNLYRQLAQEHNLPLAVFAGLFVLGICIIIAAAISG